MARFFIRDFDNREGYKAITRPVSAEGRGWSQREGFVPWAILPNGEVIYAALGAHRGPTPHGSGWLKYDMESSQERRRLCQSEFGQYALDWKHVGEIVGRVSARVSQYLLAHQSPEAIALLSHPENGFAHYLYTKHGSFGRLGEDMPGDKTVVWNRMLAALNASNTKVEQHLAIHDAVGRKLLAGAWKDAPYFATYEAIKEIVRPEWYDLKDYRGRKNRQGRAAATTVSGVVRSDRGVETISRSVAPLQSRVRGVDSFEFSSPALRTQEKLDAEYAAALEQYEKPKPGPKGRPPVREMAKELTVEERYFAESTAYYADLKERNLLFGAGPSGTTGTLLAAAMSFGGMAHGDDRLKEYAMGIAGYLVGGGMHSYHEEMIVAERVGVPYEPGAYLKSLPAAFLRSPEFEDWLGRYYDIVMLGGIHWSYAKDDWLVADRSGPSAVLFMANKLSTPAKEG